MVASTQQNETAEFLSGKLSHVDVAGIERELQKLWKSASEVDSDIPSVTRACSANLLLLSDAADAESSASDVLDTITQRHPCRAILGIKRDANEPSIEAWVSARCHLTGAKGQICCEQITIRSQGQGFEELASVAIPLMIPDLPVYVWWGADGLNQKSIAPFKPVLDRLIVDSQKQVNQLQYLRDLHFLAHGWRKYISVSDLSWRRLSPWRQAFALAFETKHGPMKPDDLRHVRSLEIKYSEGGGAAKSKQAAPLSQALLMVSWIAAQLKLISHGIKHLGTHRLAFHLKQGHHEVEVFLTGVESASTAPGALLCATATVYADAKSAHSTLVVERGLENDGLTVRLMDAVNKGPAPGSCSKSTPTPFNDAQDSTLIDEELENPEGDHVFMNTLAWLSENFNIT